MTRSRFLIFLFHLFLPLNLWAADTPENFKVAFIGDQGFDSKSKSVLKLIKAEGAELVIHQGDFDYLDNPGFWESNVNKYLGEDFPYIASAGNHDAKKWFDKEGYRERLEERARRVPGMNCTGDHGVNGVCIYKGILVVTSGVGSIGKKTYEYLEGILDQADAFTWKICSWHKQQREYQVGGKGDAVPWKYYQLCRMKGAIIAQGHEHSYARTHTMDDFENFSVVDQDSQIRVGEGMSFAFTNGLGGASIRKQERCKKKGECPYFAKIYTRDQGANAGALFCSFNVKGQSNLAECYFKSIKGERVDEFEILSLNASLASVAEAKPEILWYPTSRSTAKDLWQSSTDPQQCL